MLQKSFDTHIPLLKYGLSILLLDFKKLIYEIIHCFSSDGKYILTGGEDDLVQVWSTEERKIVAWGEGHNSWVTF